MSDWKEGRNKSHEFAQQNLVELAQEIVQWKSTGLLKQNGKVMELAKSCKTWIGANSDHKLIMAENIINDLCLKRVAESKK